eukprot:COSAG01_NODE_1603_length_9758_cov_7.506471_8_plen_144_part_00
MTTRGGGGESFLRVHWVAVPKALRARRVNRRRRRPPQGQPTRDKQPACGLPPSLSDTVRTHAAEEERSAVRRRQRRRGAIHDERTMPWVAPTAVLTGGGGEEEEGHRPGSGGERGDSSSGGGGGGQRQRVAGDLRTSALDPAH